MNLEALVSSGVPDVLAEAMLGTLAKERIRDTDIPGAGTTARAASVVVYGALAGTKKILLPDPEDHDIGEGEQITLYNSRTGGDIEVSGFPAAIFVYTVARGHAATFIYLGGGWAVQR